MKNGPDFEQLYRSEHRRLEAQITRRLGSANFARDLVHDLFVKLWGKAEQIALSPAYLSSSARNMAIDHLRSEGVRQQYRASTLPEQLAAPVPTPQDELEAKQAARLFEDALRGLPERTRHVYLLHRVHKRSYKDIAWAMGISVSAVEKHIAKALLALRNAVK